MRAVEALGRGGRHHLGGLPLAPFSGIMTTIRVRWDPPVRPASHDKEALRRTCRGAFFMQGPVFRSPTIAKPDIFSLNDL
jgi:hypothetical protein